jgi:Delta7-sterol 5-desaturase
MHIQDYLHFWEVIAARYVIFAGLAFLVFYVLPWEKMHFRKIQERIPKGKDYYREIGSSALTMAIFAAVPVLLIKNNTIRPHTTYYTDIHAHGMLYFYAAFLIMFLMHDTYFYWAHRFMHHPAVFRLVHLLHHRSTNPSPWAAYAFHPLEAIMEVGIVAIFLFTIPIHKFHLLFFFLFMIIYNVYGHLGYELYPKGFRKHPIGRWINTSVSHNQHHQYFTGNYGLYLLFWDRVMGTLRTDYDQRYDAVCEDAV